MEKKNWIEPEVTEFEIAERTENLPGDGPDAQTGLGEVEGGGGGGGGGGS